MEIRTMQFNEVADAQTNPGRAPNTPHVQQHAVFRV